MAEQHFYSRVPARISMYNKYDSFDTFAHSAGLTREFIERDLALVYADKLNKNDVALVRRGEIAPVYYQCLVKNGSLVQGCITYLPLDYTKERSSYLTHTLVFGEEERKCLLYNSDKTIFNSEMYKQDISDFDITNPLATPNSDYPTVQYQYQDINTVQGCLKKYDSEFVKNFIGSILLSLCKKGKNVYFKLDANDQEVSLMALKIINELVSILPYNLRSSLSFITYLNDPTKYPTFKLKCLSSSVAEVSLEKGIFFDFQTKLITSLPHEDIVSNKTLINFFYSLLENNEVRVEFLNYINKIVEVFPNTQNLNLKTLSDLVFLFCTTSGFFMEEQILPTDEQVYEAFCVYDKYRNALNDEYRITIYKSLKRYVNRHVAIPKDIFSKVMRLYPGDIKSAKRIVMNVVLELIHTDIMREKLFVFISNNYLDEDDDIKEVINADLCRVFYGGFMQNNILKFFNNNFENEPLVTKDQIVEKLLLSIRTLSIQNSILEFFDKYYDCLSKDHLAAFYNTFFEMLVECDDLASSLVNLINKHISKENENVQESIRERLIKVLEADYHKREHLMLPILMKETGFCIDAVIIKIFGDWSNRKIFVEYLDILKEKTLLDKTNILTNNILLVQDLSEIVCNKLIDNLPEIYENNIGRDLLYDWIEADALVKDAMLIKNNQVLQFLLNNIIVEGISKSLKDIFRIKYRTDGLEVILAYAKENAILRTKEEYKLVSNYVSMTEYISNNKIAEAFTIFNNLPEDKKIRSYIADHINTCIVDRKNYIESFYYDMMIQELKTGVINLDKLYLQYKDIYKREYFLINGTNANSKKAGSDAVVRTLNQIFEVCYEVSKVNGSLKELICKDESKLKVCIIDFMNNYEGSSKKWLNNLVANIISNEFVEYFQKMVSECKNQNNSFFGKLFGKK